MITVDDDSLGVLSSSIVVSRNIDHRNQNREPDSREGTLHVDLAYPPSSGVSAAHAAASLCAGTTPIILYKPSTTHTVDLRLHQVMDDGALFVNGITYKLSSIQQQSSGDGVGIGGLEWYPLIEPGPFIPQTWTTAHASNPRYKRLHRSYTFWADEVLLYFPPPTANESDTHGEAQHTGTLIRAHVRTLAAILRTIEPES